MNGHLTVEIFLSLIMIIFVLQVTVVIRICIEIVDDVARQIHTNEDKRDETKSGKFLSRRTWSTSFITPSNASHKIKVLKLKINNLLRRENGERLYTYRVSHDVVVKSSDTVDRKNR